MGDVLFDPVAMRVYDVLVRTCDASDDESTRHQFDLFWEKRHSLNEFRFCGALGFGGKFFSAHGEWWVSCYPEDKTPEREDRIKRANAALAFVLGEEANRV